ncbi:MAG: hypothetical protein ACLFTK_08235 [Anaerolineales bacterium]
MEDKLIVDGLRFETLHEGQIAWYQASTISDYVLSEWSKHLIQVLEDWPTERRLRLLYDLSSPGASLTYLVLSNRDVLHIGVDIKSRQFAERKLKDGIEQTPRLALLVSNALSGQVANKHYRAPITLKIDAQTFFDRQAALDWLM